MSTTVHLSLDILCLFLQPVLFAAFLPLTLHYLQLKRSFSVLLYANKDMLTDTWLMEWACVDYRISRTILFMSWSLNIVY